jgi:hypothetical protein
MTRFDEHGLGLALVGIVLGNVLIMLGLGWLFRVEGTSHDVEFGEEVT